MGLGNRNMALVFKIRRGLLNHLTVAADPPKPTLFVLAPSSRLLLWPELVVYVVDVLGAVDIVGPRRA